MAKLISSHHHTGNYAEDFLCEQLVQAFDDDCIIYRNREVFGKEFDVAMLIPDIGIVIFEVKGWNENTVLHVENGDTIVIQTNEGEVKSSPQKQVRGYRFSLERKIRQETGKFPLVFTMVCYPQMPKSFYIDKGLNIVTEEQFTLLKEDFTSTDSLLAKVNNAIREVSHWNRAKFTADLILKVRSLFETNIDLDSLNEQQDSGSMRYVSPRNPYSVFLYLKDDIEHQDEQISKLAGYYAQGTKLYVIVERHDHLRNIIASIDKVLAAKNLIRNKDDLLVAYSRQQRHFPDINDCSEQFSAFNCMVTVTTDKENLNTIPSFTIIDGDLSNIDQDWLKRLADHSYFNLEQYLIEHVDPQQNIVIRAGAGTGKTHTMISRIGFLCSQDWMPINSVVDRIVMITFTNEATEQMKQRLRTHFLNYYLITGRIEYLNLATKIDSMQISTIHSFVKRLLSVLGTEFGYGVDVTITSTQHFRKKKISAALDAYISEMKKQHGDSYLNELGMPIYQIRDIVLELITQLYSKNIEVATLKEEDFGTVHPESEWKELHRLLAYNIPQIEKEYGEELVKENKVHLHSIISLFYSYLQKPESQRRIKELQTSIPQFMFIDEFQDTDDTQIKLLLTIAEILDFKIFAVGDIKQCIYRFRGAQEKAFDLLPIQDKSDRWREFALQRNYRTDVRLLKEFEPIFVAWGKDNDELFPYNQETDKLLGNRSYNTGLEVKEFFNRLTIQEEKDRLPVLFGEIRRLQKLIQSDLEKGKKLSAKEQSIAILVRENWQAELIRKHAANENLTILTKTGGDLYQSLPARDMLVLLNALVHFDQADYLYELASSNFFALEIPRSYLYKQRKSIIENSWRNNSSPTSQADYLIKQIDNVFHLKKAEMTWAELVKSLRVKPILQVLREVYSYLKPWQNFSNNEWKQQYYRLNVDLLFEQILANYNADRLTINLLADFILQNMRGKIAVDTRLPDDNEDKPSIDCITVHKSKGLEYGHVIIPFASFPIDEMKDSLLHVYTFLERGKCRIGYRISIKNNDSRIIIKNNYYNDNAEIAEMSREETRILYVAMTRAIRSFSWIELANNKKHLSWQALLQKEEQSK